ncbi:MAG: hypothetical protein J4F39_18165 [Candidatus Latescibacteria bacterium]|nr:hypothetical protein [Candidatus Latescibacterota bacterium]
MQLLFYNDYTLGVLKDGRVFDAGSAVEHADILPPEAVMEQVITGFDELRPRLEAAVTGDGQGLDMVAGARAAAEAAQRALCLLQLPRPRGRGARRMTRPNSRTRGTG